MSRRVIPPALAALCAVVALSGCVKPRPLPDQTPPGGDPPTGNGDAATSLTGDPGVSPDAGDASARPPTYPTSCPGGVVQFWDLAAEPSSVDFSPDGVFVASGSRDGAVAVHRVADGSLFASHGKHRLNVPSVRFSPDGLAVAAGSDDGTLTHWSVGPDVPRVWVHGAPVLAAAFSESGQDLLVGGEGGVYLLKVAGLVVGPRQEQQFFNRSVAFLPGEQEVVVASGERAGRLTVLRASDLAVVRSLGQHLDPVLRVAVASRMASSILYTLGAQLRAVVLPSGVPAFFDQHSRPITDLRLSTDGARFVTTGADATRIWTAHNWRVQRSLPGASATGALSPDGKRLARGDGRRVLIHCLD